MAIRKPTMPAEKSAAFAEFLKQQASVQDSQFKPGSIIEGTVSAVKGDDVFVDIGYKSEGVVSLDEFADKEAVKPGLKFQVMLRDQTGLLSAVLSVFAQCGANILTINQSIPVSGCATITISAETAGMSESMETLMNRLVAADGVIRAEILAG